MKRLAAVFALASLACAPTPRSQQLDAVKYYSPAALSKPEAAAPSATRALKVLAWADDDYRDTVLHWEATIRAQLGRASEYTAPTLGVTLELVDVRPWSHRAPAGDLKPSLDALIEVEPGTDVDLVLGFVNSLPTLETDHDLLGRAELLGKHAVLRGIESPAEGDAIRKAFTALDVSEQEKLYRDRKLHKETVVLLHEWAHTLGGVHERDATHLLSAQYNLRAAGFGPETLALLRAVLDARAAHASEEAQAKLVLERLRATPGAWRPEHLEAHLARLEERARGKQEAPADPPLSKDELQRFDRAAQLFKASMYAEAHAQLKVLLERRPKRPELLAFSCQLELAQGVDALATCRAAVEVAKDAWPSLLLARGLAGAKDVVGAREVLLAVPKSFLDGASPEAAAALAETAQTLSLVTLAEEMAAKAPDAAKKAREWAARVRRTRGLKPGVEPVGAGEGEFLDTCRAVQQALDRGALADAKQRTTALEAKYPKQPGPQVLLCELKLRQMDLGGAQRACETAIARWDEAAYAHYLLGVLAEGTRDARRAASAFSRTIALDPTNEDAWRRLASLYRSAHDEMALDALKGRYQAQFGRPL